MENSVCGRVGKSQDAVEQSLLMVLVLLGEEPHLLSEVRVLGAEGSNHVLRRTAA